MITKRGVRRHPVGDINLAFYGREEVRRRVIGPRHLEIRSGFRWRRNKIDRWTDGEESQRRIQIVGLIADIDRHARVLAPIIKAKDNVAELVGLTIPGGIAVRIGAVQPNAPLLVLAVA